MLLAFLLGVVLSFIGSVPPGVINTSVVHATLRRGLRAGLVLAAGASLVEWVQAFVAVLFGRFFAAHPEVDFWFNVLATVVFAGLAGYYLLVAKPVFSLDEEAPNGHVGDFLRGVGAAALNFLAIPYWVFYTTWLLANDYLHADPGSLVVFSTGVMLGTFALLWCYARWAHWLQRRGSVLLRYTYTVIGLIFLGLTVWQVVRLV